MRSNYLLSLVDIGTDNIHILEISENDIRCGEQVYINSYADSYADSYANVTEEFMRVHCANLQNAGIRICGNCVSTLYRDNR